MKGILIFFISLTFPLPAANAAQVSAFAEISKANIIINEKFVLSIYINHSVGDEVEMGPLNLPPSFLTSEIRSFPRFVRGDNGSPGQVWTVYEISLIPQKAANFHLGPYIGFVKNERFQTNSIELFVTVPFIAEKTEPNVTFYWSGAEKPLKIGKDAIIYLHYKGLFDKNEKKDELFNSNIWFSPPKEAILENLALNLAEKESDICLKLRIIPLKFPDNGVIKIIAPKIKNYSIPDVTILLSK